MSEVTNLPGPEVLTRIIFHRNYMSHDLLRNVWLSITWDDQKTPGIYAPLPYIFAQYFGWRDLSSLPMEVGEGVLALPLPMPYSRNARIGLELRKRSKELKVSVQVT